MNDTALFVAVFLACVVEAVEATTIVVAAGATRHWRSALSGSAAAIIVLGVAVAIAGPAITLLPLGVLRVVVGGLLLVFGLQWIRKAVLRASGYKPLHDEDAIYRRQVEAASAAGEVSRFGIRDWYAFTLSFKGVLLEGLEVVFIVLTFGTNQHNIPLSALAAAAAVVLVATLGAVVRGPLSRVPENTLKFVVGIMLVSFGAFWGAEGAGAVWPGSDAALLVLVPAVAVFSLGLVLVMRSRRAATVRRASTERAEPSAVMVPAGPGADGTSGSGQTLPSAATPTPSAADRPEAADRREAGPVLARLKGFGLFWYDFVIGDNWQIAAGVALALLLIGVLSAHAFAWIIAPCAIAVLIPYGVWRAARR